MLKLSSKSGWGMNDEIGNIDGHGRVVAGDHRGKLVSRRLLHCFEY